MVTLVVGILIASGAGALISALLAAASPLMRVGVVGAPLVSAIIGAGGSMLLQLLGGGALQFVPGTGMIDWPPVVATLAVGGGCAAIASFAIALMRLGGRSHPVRRRSMPNRRPRPPRGRSVGVRPAGRASPFRRARAD